MIRHHFLERLSRALALTAEAESFPYRPLWRGNSPLMELVVDANAVYGPPPESHVSRSLVMTAHNRPDRRVPELRDASLLVSQAYV
ncbi:hypothetical protein, partial [Microvirga sp. KLBC 81]|uniref:hypothetical protein n=1 Tax=Microvirga sp. KLBC 81 TaxID=1862707 RepID=UPI00197B9FB4